MLSAARYLSSRPRRRHQQVGHLLDAEDHRQLPWLGAKLHVELHLLAPAGHAEEEAQRHDARVERRRRDPGVRHVELVAAQVVRRCRVRGSPEEGGEILDRPNVGLLRLVAHSADAHVFDHPLAQRRGPLLRHGNLLSDEGKDPDRQTEMHVAKSVTFRSTLNASHTRHCRGAASSMGRSCRYRRRRREGRTAAFGAAWPDSHEGLEAAVRRRPAPIRIRALFGCAVTLKLFLHLRVFAV